MAFTLKDSHVDSEAGTWVANAATDYNAHVFTATSAYTITKVELNIYRVGNVGTVEIEIQGADGSNKPDGNILASGTIESANIGLTRSYVECTLGDGTALSNGVLYAIVLHGDSLSGANYVLNSRGGNDGDGVSWYSTNSGSSWNLIPTNEFGFKTYSGADADYKDVSGTSGIVFTTGTPTPDVMTTYNVSGAATMTFHTFTPAGVVSSNITNAVPTAISRLVAIGNDAFYYET
jgi:hypothetical protein